MVFRHYSRYNFLLRYPCCETFVAQGFCIACIGKGENDFSDNGGCKLFPYLLYVGEYIFYTFYREMPVCHINVAEAKRIMSSITNQQQQENLIYIEVWDTEGKCHELRFCRDGGANAFYNHLFHYVLSSVSTCALQVPLSNFNLAEQYLWAIQNRAMEILEICRAMSSHTKNGYKQKKSFIGWGDKQVSQLQRLACDIFENVDVVLHFINLEDMERLKSIDNALK